MSTSRPGRGCWWRGSRERSRRRKSRRFATAYGARLGSWRRRVGWRVEGHGRAGSRRIGSRSVPTKRRAVAAERAKSPRREPRRYLLAGLVVCERCGARMVARPRQDGVRRYVCVKGPGFAGCNGTMILAEPLEALVVEAVMVRLDSPAL